MAEAPGRIEVLGNHTDYQEGLVLGAAIDRMIRVRGAALDGGRILLRSTSYPPVEANITDLQPQLGDARWANYPLGVASELLLHGIALTGFSARYESDLPVGAGLGSSAAISVATVFFLLKLSGRELAPLEIAKLCQRSEHRFAGVQSGLLDQVMSIFGKTSQLVFFDCRTEEIRAIAFPNDLAFIVADSGTKRELAVGKYNERRNETDLAAKALRVRALRDISLAQRNVHLDIDPLLLRRAGHVIEENDRVLRSCELLARGDVAGFGQLLNASHESSRTNFENSTRELDRLVDLARRQPGVLGARLTGAGFGGAIIALCAAATAEAAAQHLACACTGAFICLPGDGALPLCHSDPSGGISEHF
jgi:galactokinase